MEYLNENKFEIAMAEHSDAKLISVLKNRNDYQSEAIDAAIKLAIKRKLILNREDMDLKYPLSETTLSPIAAANNNELREQAKKDILYGALWCGGGIIATAADIGFIFWGAIVFGGFQLIKGLINNK